MRTCRCPARLRVPTASLEGSGTLAVSRDGDNWQGRLSLRAPFSFSTFISCECIIYSEGYFFQPLFCF